MSLKVSRILHAGYLFESGSTRIAFDPLFENPFSRNCFAFPSVEFDLAAVKKLQLQAVFISHYHDDHFSMESLNHLDRKTPVYVFCLFDELFLMLKEMGFVSVHKLEWEQKVYIGNFIITPRRALDADVDCILRIQVGNLNVLNVVDSWIDPAVLKTLQLENPWDLILWPFQTLREVEVLRPSRMGTPVRTLPPEWISQLKLLKPRALVPSSCQFIHESWSWYNQALFPISYQQFEFEIKNQLSETEVIRLDPGCSLELKGFEIKRGKALDWILRVKNKTAEAEYGFVDYSFDADQKIPSTAEIAKKFPPLSGHETSRVLFFCQKEIIDRFNSLTPSESPCFLKPRFWRLSVYDHLGEAKEFYFLLENGKIFLETNRPSSLGWRTEIPISRLYGALENGESLSSLYVRINDQSFDPETELDLEDVDVLEDPLLRALYTGIFGAYQRAQLKRLEFSMKLLSGPN